MNLNKPLASAIVAQAERQVAFLQQLVQANSVNDMIPGASNPTTPIERVVAHRIAEELAQLGLNPTLVGISAARPNVLCIIPGTEHGEKTLILTTHMDTVAPSGYTRDPWGGQIEQRRLYGVGAADAKAQIAAMVYAVAALRQANFPFSGRIILAFVVDEESGACSSYGTRYLLDHGYLSGDGAIIGEPGNTMIAIGHRGLYRFRLTIQGEATHTGRKAWEQKREGRNAIVDMALLIQALASEVLSKTTSPLYPERISMLTFPTLIQGGSNINVVPDSCEAYGDARLLPGMSAEDIRHRIITHLRKLSIEQYHLDDLIDIPSSETDPQTEIVQVLASSVESVTGKHPPLLGSGPACDGWMFITKDIPTVCGYGVACGGVHGADEWVNLDSLQTLTQVYAQTAIGFLRED
jgi:succinyl-diaminopimelate desuccinylase